LAAGIDTNSVVATDVLGRVAFWSPNVRYKDMLGLADPAVASSLDGAASLARLTMRSRWQHILP